MLEDEEIDKEEDFQILVKDCVKNIRACKKYSSSHFKTIDHLLGELQKKNKRIAQLEK